jgi:hypothetical protein
VAEAGTYMAGTRWVTRAKYAISDFNRQGRAPRRPMPRLGVVATINVRENRGWGGIVELVEDMFGLVA